MPRESTKCGKVDGTPWCCNGKHLGVYGKVESAGYNQYSSSSDKCAVA